MRWPHLAALGAAVVGLAAIASSAIADGLTYYETPTELSRSARQAATVRLGGLVEPGSVIRTERGARLLLTDGVTDVPVAYAAPLPAAVQEGQGAVVEGVLAEDGTFRATQVLLRHSNEYRRAS